MTTSAVVQPAPGTQPGGHGVVPSTEQLVCQGRFVDCETLTGKLCIVDACCFIEGVNSYSPAV